MNSSLEGLKVIDFTQVIMGPSCTAQLADHGAEVIKIERPEYGELTRQFGPFKDGESLPYESYNRNKKSIAVNLKSKEGKKIIYKLASKSDVIVNNFRPGVMDSLGFSYEDLYKINKKIIYACGSGFGLSGPLKEKMGHESVAEALGGFLGKNGEKGRKPRRAPGAVADASTGLHLTVGILLALNARHKTGEGQVVDVSLLDSMMWMQGWEVSSASNLDQVTFNPDPLDSGVYETSDGLIVMSGLFISNPLKNISEVIGVEDLSKDERFKSMDDIAKNASDLLEIIQNKIIKKDSEYWVTEFEKSNIICSKILGMEEAINQPQIKHNKIIVEIKKKNIKRNIVGVPVRLSKTPGSIRTFPPKLGENTEEVLLSLGYKSTEISDFKNKKVVE
jgi:crotonobetainyl-CoA:carnitine CoA-transferase CaiB-like acyl-CoA transferase|tara:strand:+ start:805 stop:1977 length:1173 start_codon:yes stop_codon:yes gene_type:complete